MTVAVGFFDGVHLGHRAILAGADVALTFENHPLAFLAPERAPRLIMSWAEKAQAIRDLGVHVTAIDFDADVAGWSPERFLERLRGYATGWSERLAIPAEPLRIRCGANWRFGKGGAGDAAFARAHGIETTVVPYAEHKGEPISSTRIRKALEAGELEDAAAMLGRPFVVRGTVFAGKGLGRGLGYPTLNLRLDLGLRLPLGVYAVAAGGVRGVANFGRAPTMGERAWSEPVLEVHFLEPPPAEPPPCVTLRRYLRPERRFASLAELQAQIARDCEEARRFGTAERDEKGDLTIEKREISSDPTALNLKFVSETENTPLSNEAKF